MELGSEEKYAAAAIFTLALHLSQTDAGIAEAAGQEASSAWGQRDTLDWEGARESKESAKADEKAAEWSAFWGWDCCGPNGILERMYRALGVPVRSWSGLKQLPEVGGGGTQRRGYMKMVFSCISILDSEVPKLYFEEKDNQTSEAQPPQLHPGAHAGQPDLDIDMLNPSSAPESLEGLGTEDDAQQRAVRDDLFVGLIGSDSDSDLEEDLANIHLQRRLIDRSNSCNRSGSATPAVPGAATVAAPHSGQISPAEKQEVVNMTGNDTSPKGGRGPVLPADAGADIPAGRALQHKKSYSRAEALLRALEQQPVKDLGPLTAQKSEESSSDEDLPHAPPTPVDPSNSSLEQPVELSPDLETTEQCSVTEKGEAEARPQVGNLAEQKASPAQPVKSATMRKSSIKAVGALWELLEASVSQSRRSSEEEDNLQPGPSLIGGLPPAQRFYDARTRTALKYVANWLGVPWSKMVAFEQLLAHQLLVPSEKQTGAVVTPWEKSIRAAKIGAATIGIGALFAVTGGIAAPAIAAGVGAAIGLAGGTAAMATGVSGFLASTAGGAIVASTVGAAGGGVAAARVANRIGEVKEFGFWEVDAEALQAADPVQDPATEAAASSRSGSLGTASLPPTSQPGPNKWHPLQQAAAHGSAPHLAGSERQGYQRSRGRRDDQAGGDDNDDLHFRKPDETRDPFLLSDNASAQAAPLTARELGTLRSSSMELAEPATEMLPTDGPARDAVPMESRQPGSDADSGHIMLQPESSVSRREIAGEMFAVEPARHADSLGPGIRPMKGVKEGSKAPEESWWQGKKWKEPPMLLTPIATGRRVDDMRLSLTIGINGWIAQRRDFISIWHEAVAGQKSTELFTLVWESKELIALNNAILDFISTQAGQEALKWTVQHFFFTGLVAALALPAMVYSLTQIIDTSWSVALQRAQRAGRLLAHILAAGAHGDRPVILVGYSIGARLVFHCLLELSRLQAKGIVEHACMLGMPVALRPERWAMARSVVAGRLINGYSRKDWLLFAVYRGTNGFLKTPAGLCPVPCPGVENINLTSIIGGHFDYINKMGEVLELVDMF